MTVIQNVSCNLCKSSEAKILFRSEDYPDRWKCDILRCQQCGLIFRKYNTNYKASSSDNHSQFLNPLDYPDKCSLGKMSIFRYYLDEISSYRSYNHILDVGTGHGHFLKLCIEWDWEVWGVEINPELVEYSKNEWGIDVFLGSLEEARYLDNFFDAVTLWRVLDYLSEPDKVLKEIYRILRPGGAIFLRFPNASFHIPSRWLFVMFYKFCKGVKRLDHSVIHHYSFNRSTICRYLRKAGFKYYEVKNAIRTSLYEKSREPTFRKLISLFLRSIEKISKRVTGGRCLLAPSLWVKAIKF